MGKRVLYVLIVSVALLLFSVLLSAFVNDLLEIAGLESGSIILQKEGFYCYKPMAADKMGEVIQKQQWLLIP